MVPDARRHHFALFLAFGRLQPPEWDRLARVGHLLRDIERLSVGLQLFYVQQTCVVSGND